MLVINVQLCWTVSVMFLSFVVTIIQKSGCLCLDCDS